MAEKSAESAVKEAKPSIISYIKAWGKSSVPPTGLATLIAAQHLQPPQLLPLLFAPVLLLATYINLNGHVVEAAGTSAAWSALYLVLAARRRQPLMRRWGVRGLVRGSTMGIAAANVGAGGWVYAFERSK